MIRKWGALMAVLLLAPEAMACQFDTDCAVGSKCVKTGADIYGYCAGGMNPGNSNDRKPVYDPLEPSTDKRRYSTCQFDTDCGPSNRCAKEAFQIRGVCVAR